MARQWDRMGREARGLKRAGLTEATVAFAEQMAGRFRV
jgi:hypothetical protein